MSREKENNNILTLERPSGTIEVKSHPEDILDVEPEVLSLMQSRLKGESFDEIYGKEDRLSNGLLIRQEKKKLLNVFSNRSEVLQAFSSLSSIKEIRQELRFTGLNRTLLAAYVLKLSHGESVDEVDAYVALIESNAPKTKRMRLAEFTESKATLNKNTRTLFEAVSSYYLMGHFTPFTITKEMMQLIPVQPSVFKSEEFTATMNDLLSQFYRSSNE